MNSIWLVITIWGLNGNPAMQIVPFQDMASCELAAQNLPGPMLAEKFAEWRTFYNPRVAWLPVPGTKMPSKPGGTFVCVPAREPPQ